MEKVLDLSMLEKGNDPEGYGSLLGIYMSWLMTNAEVNGERENLGEITLGQFWEWDDPPVVLLDEIYMRYADGVPLRRMVILDCSPFHDEGGHTELTAWYDWEGGIEDAETRVEMQQGHWVLEHIIQCFDTDRFLIWAQGKLVGVEGMGTTGLGTGGKGN
jgi:hypothetical protein